MALNVFERFIETPTLYRGENARALEPSYVPDRLPHREKEIERLAKMIAPALRGKVPSHAILYGKPGTGKTAVVKYVLRELKRLMVMKGVGELVHPVYLNCRSVDTSYSVLYNIALDLGCTRVPYTGWPLDRMEREVFNAIDRTGVVVILVLDEIDHLVDKGHEDALYLLLHMNEEIEEGGVSIVGISNDLKFAEKLEPRISSRLMGERLVFSPYNAPQLEDILRDRVELALVEGVVDDAVIKLCAAFAAQEHGDARRAISLLKKAVDIAEREGSEIVTEFHVYSAKAEIEIDSVAEVVRTLPIHAKVLLYAILLLGERDGATTTGSVYSAYRSICEHISGIRPLGSRSVSNLISELSVMGLINTEIKSFGRGRGRTRVIQPYVPIRETLRLLEDELTIDPDEISLGKQTNLLL